MLSNLNRNTIHVFYFFLTTDALVLQPVECEKSDPDNGTSTVTCNVGNPLLGKSSVSNFTVFHTVKNQSEVECRSYTMPAIYKKRCCLET